MMGVFDVAIIGSGPAGISAAISAAKNHAKVVLVEKNNQIGRKILATGNGRCNVTNANIEASRYHGGKSGFVTPIFEQFSHSQTIDYFESLGVIFKEEDHGRIFPRTNQASTIVNALGYDLADNLVTIKLGSCVKSILENKFWEIILNTRQKIEAKTLVIATGGKAAYQFGSSGDGLFWSQKLGHTITPLVAALVPLETVESWPKAIQGIKVSVKITVLSNNNVVIDSSGDLLFTHFGLSGPAILNISGYVSEEMLQSKENITLKIDLMPEVDERAMLEKINLIFEKSGAKSVINNLYGFLPLTLLSVALEKGNINKDKKSAETSQSERKIIISSLKSFRASIKKTRPLKEAQVTKGGIALDEIDNFTLQSRLKPNLYFAGEILDIDADSGGFNLQWAWSSGFVAGKHSARAAKK